MSPRALLDMSQFWSMLAVLTSKDIIHLLLAVRVDERGGANSFYSIPPTIYTLDRLPRSAVTTCLTKLTEVGFVASPQADWRQLQQELASDLNDEDEDLPGGDRVLPIQMIVALKGLQALSQLTVVEYRRAGGLVGLERKFVQDGIHKASLRSRLPEPEVLSVLLALCSDDGRLQSKSLSEVCDFHVSLRSSRTRLSEIQVDECLTELEIQLIVRRVHSHDFSAGKWMLYHSYLVRGILEAERFERKWEVFLRQRFREFHEAPNAYRKWKALLSPFEQMNLAVRLGKGGRSAGLKKYIRLSRARWLSYVVLFVCVYLAADAGVEYPGSDWLRKISTAYNVSLLRRTASNDQIREVAERLAQLATAELLSRQRGDGWFNGLKHPAAERDFSAHSQSVASILRSSSLLSALPTAVQNGPDLMFSEGANVAEAGSSSPFGWRGQDGQGFTRIEPALWTLSAISLKRAKDGAVPDEQYRYVAAVLRRHYAGGGAWNLGPDQEPGGDHSVYESALAEMALLDAHAAGADIAVNDESLEQLIEHTAKWLARQYLKDATYKGWGDGEDAHIVSQALSFQV